MVNYFIISSKTQKKFFRYKLKIKNKELAVGDVVYIIEPPFREYKIKRGVITSTPTIKSNAYAIQFNDAAQTTSAYYRSELHTSKKTAQAIRAEMINNDIIRIQRSIETYNALIADLQANVKSLQSIL